ncbi:hypothetical protein HGM15179_008583 [Zosterops borbonicus]|uniref:Uncharacterized protein n=1 Tax=Zosterops borbonicus TaxID=364589 RepID=A0A8K1LM15_9PASS|nr:hypothetical protein HGM15179_008583 [Zosterops borbonicus]
MSGSFKTGALPPVVTSGTDCVSFRNCETQPRTDLCKELPANGAAAQPSWPRGNSPGIVRPSPGLTSARNCQQMEQQLSHRGPVETAQIVTACQSATRFSETPRNLKLEKQHFHKMHKVLQAMVSTFSGDLITTRPAINSAWVVVLSPPHPECLPSPGSSATNLSTGKQVVDQQWTGTAAHEKTTFKSQSLVKSSQSHTPGSQIKLRQKGKCGNKDHAVLEKLLLS